mmetsp:Transcript_88811/g.185638  ORF Transcript_88811/g.185638 Transcript_88811/m.185638 type:complete len:242 (+) Transcript_88811:180-905(+)|eukprot:CAMPEP_0206488948 /NCGR_PEP_ID=MMETSP0324_2-20121206/42793_1 /ASSEMBLY_ACC=CAM_ASM_000836 /TAXON_ID=2866 /ORGANISM="Crypthecodinium cohnii, Strain Seligo" /LENGTH=241 /DNA_ID=CAMNT_0053968223 /DNA_START=102 /DNA_END=827 /DNA_ORIENTATION=+
MGADQSVEKPKEEKEEDVPPKLSFPEDGLFDLKLLSNFDGRTNPICLGVCGKVIDCSASENIQYNEGYGKLWAGKDATWSLATLSLKPEDANILTYKMSDFSEEQKTALAGWYKHFTTKYPVVGKLREYEGWDFSEIEALSEHQTPFGAIAGAGAGAEGEEEEAGGGAAASGGGALPSGAVTLSSGDAVRITGIEDLEGKKGTLITYRADRGGFEVKLEDDQVVVVPASNLRTGDEAEEGL